MKLQDTINTKQKVLVLGGRGFIGRHVVKHVNLLGAEVVISSRHINGKNKFSRQVILHKMNTADDWLEVIKGSDVVVNTVGILRQRRGETYQQVHHHAIKTLAGACARTNTRLVHISALGLQNSVKSGFSISKRDGERALQNSAASWAIVRPSLVDGEGGFGARWFQWVAKWPVHIIPKNAKGMFAPIDVDDLGEAIARIALIQNHKSNRVYELAGNQQVAVADYLKLLRPARYQRPAITIKVPTLLARMVSHFFDLIHFSPYSFGHYEMLKKNNLPVQNHLEGLLGRPATVIRSRESLNRKGFYIKRRDKFDEKLFD